MNKAATKPSQQEPDETATSQPFRMPLIGDEAPAFKAHTTQGPIEFPKDYAGKWVILFSHPADFTPVCTTEFMTFATMMPEFKALNCELIGLSIDSHFAHIAWLRTIKEKIKYKNMANVEVTFPLIADVKMEVAKRFGMVQPAASDTQAVRAVFLIDPKGKVRALLYYPLSNGRNFPELKRLLIALQSVVFAVRSRTILVRIRILIITVVKSIRIPAVIPIRRIISPVWIVATTPVEPSMIVGAVPCPNADTTAGIYPAERTVSG